MKFRRMTYTRFINAQFHKQTWKSTCKCGLLQQNVNMCGIRRNSRPRHWFSSYIIHRDAVIRHL
ncbi:hypothetical protein J6590_102410 [Homalodisca vitripennis]|nr:hypothetical protein J6590_102410 [Homalodisca vitripennis]